MSNNINIIEPIFDLFVDTGYAVGTGIYVKTSIALRNLCNLDYCFGILLYFYYIFILSYLSI